jgi:hypothetical protein
MKSWSKFLGPAVAGFVVGVVVTSVLAYTIAVRDLHQSVAISYYQSAVEAQGAVRNLQALRKGDLAGVTSALEVRMDSAVLFLAGYEDAIPFRKREEYIYRALAEVAKYRNEHPAHFEYPAQYSYYKKALDMSDHRVARFPGE